MTTPRSLRIAGFSAAFGLVASLAASPSRAQENAWQEAATKPAGPLAAELAKAFPGIDQEGSGDYMGFVTALKAAGLGKPQAAPAPAAERAAAPPAGSSRRNSSGSSTPTATGPSWSRSCRARWPSTSRTPRPPRTAS